MSGFIVAVLAAVALVLLLGGYLVVVAGSRRRMESLHQPAEDLRRADDDRTTPYDGSSGLV